MSTLNHASRLTPHAPRFTHYALLLLLFLLAAYLRLNHLDWTEFKQDEAHLSQIAYDMARTGAIPLRSIGASTGVVNLPLAAWLLAIPYAVTSSPIVATAFLAGLNVLAVACCYAMARSWFKSWSPTYVFGALAAALLFAVAPWAIVYARKLWANDFLPLFVIGWAWTGWLTFVQKKRWWLIAHAALLGMCIQLHYSALILAPVSAVWFIAFIRRVSWRAVALAAVVIALLFAPFLIADAQQGWPNLTGFVELFKQPATADASAVRYAGLMSTGLEVHSLAGPQEFENFRALVPWADGVSWLIGLFVIAGLIVTVIDVIQAMRHRRWDDRSATAFLLATWLLLPIAGQLSHRMPLYIQYFLPILPAPFLVIGYLVARVTRTLAPTVSLPVSAQRRDGWPPGRGSTLLAMTIIVVLALAQAYQTMALQQFVAARPTPGAMSIPIGYYERLVVEAKEALQQTGGAEIIVNTRGSNPKADEYPAIFDFLLNGVAHRFVDVGQAARVYPAAPQIQIDYAPNDAALKDGAGRELIAQVDLRQAEQPGRVYRSSGYTDPPCEAAAAPQRWENGVSLLAAKIDPLKPGETAIIHLCLKIDHPVAEDDHWTAQLWDKSGHRWAQVDDNGYPTRYWRAGDVITQELALVVPSDIPAGDYVLRLGQYTWPDVKPVLAIDVAGNPYSDAVEFPAQITK